MKLKTQVIFLERIFLVLMSSEYVSLSTNTWYISIEKYKGTNYTLSWKSKGMYNSKLKPLYTAFLHSIKLSECRIGNYATKTVNAYTVYDLDAWANNPLNNFKLKNCFYGATYIAKNNHEETISCKFMEFW